MAKACQRCSNRRYWWQRDNALLAPHLVDGCRGRNVWRGRLGRKAPSLARWKDRVRLHLRLVDSASHPNKACVSQTGAARGHRCSDRVAACRSRLGPYWQAPRPMRGDLDVRYQASVAWLSPVFIGRLPRQNAKPELEVQDGAPSSCTRGRPSYRYDL